jgi:hypothetical protein
VTEDRVSEVWRFEPGDFVAGQGHIERSNGIADVIVGFVEC